MVAIDAVPDSVPENELAVIKGAVTGPLKPAVPVTDRDVNVPTLVILG